jgi:hypothetical protein
VSLKAFHDSCKKLESGTDQQLKDYYVKTSSITEIADFGSPRALTVGLKGVGKTAAYRYFTEFETTPAIIVGLNAEKYSLHLPNKDLHYSTCLKQFEHDLVMEALRAVAENESSLKKRIKGQLLDEAAEQVKTYANILKGAAARVQGGGISILGCGFTLTKADSPVIVGLRKERDLKNAQKVLTEICASGVKIRIVVDDPEQVFSASRELDAHLIGGFCLAALRLSGLIPGFKVIALLKTHIYYPILYSVDDLSKYPDHMGRLCWSKDELVSVIGDRLKWAKAKWEDVFEGTEVQARQCVKSMCENVRNGPRDLLRWLDLALQSTKGGKITLKSVEATKKKMSLNSLYELQSAHSDNYSRIEVVLETIFGRTPDHSFKPTELRQHIQNLLMKDREMMGLHKSLPWMQRENSKTFPTVLFETGSLSLHSGSRSILPYEEGYDTEALNAADHIALVPALAEALT